MLHVNEHDELKPGTVAPIDILTGLMLVNLCFPDVDPQRFGLEGRRPHADRPWTTRLQKETMDDPGAHREETCPAGRSRDLLDRPQHRFAGPPVMRLKARGKIQRSLCTKGDHDLLVLREAIRHA